MHSEDKMFQPGNDNELLQHVLLFKSFMFFQWPLVSLTERESDAYRVSLNKGHSSFNRIQGVQMIFEDL